jgi:hypothetical protein
MSAKLRATICIGSTIPPLLRPTNIWTCFLASTIPSSALLPTYRAWCNAAAPGDLPRWPARRPFSSEIRMTLCASAEWRDRLGLAVCVLH